jgi:hypothetical protein
LIVGEAHERRNGDTSGNSNRKPIPWDLILQVVGAGAAIAAWIAVVGGARVWARLYAADIPATQTLSVLPRQLLLVEGLQALLAPLLIGGGLSLFVYYSRSRQTSDKEHGRGSPRASRSSQRSWSPSDAVRRRRHRKRHKPTSGESKQGRNPNFGESLVDFVLGSQPVFVVRRLRKHRSDGTLLGMAVLVGLALLALILALLHVRAWWIVGGAGVGAVVAGALVLFKKQLLPLAIVVALAGPLVGTAIALWRVVELPYLAAIGVVTGALVWLSISALAGRSPAGVALTLFAALALWSGAVGFLRLAGAQDPENAFETATVEQKDGRFIDGLYLGGSGGDVYLATRDKPHVVKHVRDEDIALLSVDEPGSGGKPSAGERTGGKGGEIPPAGGGTLEVLAFRDTTIDGVELRLEIVGRNEGKRLVTLDLRLTNRSDRMTGRLFTVGDAFDDGVADGEGNVRDSLDGLMLTDLDASLAYPVARNEDGGCVCTDGLQRISLDPGASTAMNATFGRPQNGGKLELTVPGFLPLRFKSDG